MTIHHVTLIVDGPNLQDDVLIDAVFEAGCDDAAIARIDGIQHVDFDREAASLDHAILSAVADLKCIDGLEVVKIADPGHAPISNFHGACRTRGRQAVRRCSGDMREATFSAELAEDATGTGET